MVLRVILVVVLLALAALVYYAMIYRNLIQTRETPASLNFVPLASLMVVVLNFEASRLQVSS